jgi:hypothetical protein
MIVYDRQPDTSGGGIVDSKRRLTGLDVACGITCIALLFLFVSMFVGPLGRNGHGPMYKVRCASNLSAIAKGMNMYLLKYGDNNWYSVPADTFRGDEWLVTLYWTGIVQEPLTFHCPTTDHRGLLPRSPPAVWGTAATIPDNAIGYAGRCSGLAGRYAHRNTTSDFTESGINSASILACDKPGNHGDGISVVFFDCRVEFWAGLGDQVGRADAAAKTESPPDLDVGQLRHMDPGEP